MFIFIYRYSLYKFREHGIQTRERSKFYAEKPVCSSSSQNFGSVRIIDCYAALLVFCYGIAASISMLFVEHLFKRKFFCLHQVYDLAKETIQNEQNE